MRRRDFIKGAIALSGVGALALYARGMMGGMGMMGMGQGGMMGGGMGMMGGVDLKNYKAINKLYIPPEIKGVKKGNTRDYNLNIKSSYTQFFKGVKTLTWGINGSYLGPTIRLNVGESVSLNWHNGLKYPTTMHGHGMHLPAKMDGGVHQIIAPNSTWSAKYVVNQKACTNWYHPHIMGATAEHVLMGLAGFIIIDDKESKSLPLPKRYGIDDIPLVLQDRVFSRTGQFLYSKAMPTIMHGFKGDTLLVNGTIAPYFNAENGWIRFRVLNGSNARFYNLIVKEGLDMHIIASDNSFLEEPIAVDSVLVSPAERVEIMLDLKDYKGENIHLVDSNSGANILEIRVNKKSNSNAILPNRLTKLKPLNINRAVRKREFKLSIGGPGRLVINGRTMDKNRIDFAIKKDEYEIWEVTNSGMMQMDHNFHMHGNHFRVISRNGNRPKAWERGYKDTVYIGPNDKVKLLVKHTDYSDSKNPFMYHCHILEHEDAGMMGQFVVV